jgi:hypothetical protein
MTLDGTYERTLFWINKQTRKYAHCLFQYLVISIGRLRVKKLAEPFLIPPMGKRLWGSMSVGAPTRRIQKNSYFPPVPRCLQRQKTVLTFFCERIINIRSHRKFGTSFPLSRSPQTGACSSRQSVYRRPLSAKLQH